MAASRGAADDLARRAATRRGASRGVASLQRAAAGCAARRRRAGRARPTAGLAAGRRSRRLACDLRRDCRRQPALLFAGRADTGVPARGGTHHRRTAAGGRRRRRRGGSAARRSGPGDAAGLHRPRADRCRRCRSDAVAGLGHRRARPADGCRRATGGGAPACSWSIPRWRPTGELRFVAALALRRGAHADDAAGGRRGRRRACGRTVRRRDRGADRIARRRARPSPHAHLPGRRVSGVDARRRACICSRRPERRAKPSRSRDVSWPTPAAACASTRWPCSSARRSSTSACWNTRWRAPTCRPGSIGAPGGPIRPAARCWRCSTAPKRACRLAALPSISRWRRCPIPSEPTLPAALVAPDDEVLSAGVTDGTDDGRTRRRRRRDSTARARLARCRRRAARAVALGSAAGRVGGDRRTRSLDHAARRARARVPAAARRARCRRARSATRGRADARSRAPRPPAHVRLAGDRPARRLARRPPATWGEWLARLERLAPRVLRQPTRVLRVLAELRPMSEVGPVGIGEVRKVLAERLRLLAVEPPARRFGRIFVGVTRPGPRPRVPRGVRARAGRTNLSAETARGPAPARRTRDSLLDDALPRRDQPRQRRAPAAAAGHRRGDRTRSTSRTRVWTSTNRGRACRRSTRSTSSAR